MLPEHMRKRFRKDSRLELTGAKRHVSSLTALVDRVDAGCDRVDMAFLSTVIGKWFP